MDEQITASAIISFCGEWEDEAVRFYEQLAQRFEAQQTRFDAFAKECARHKALVLRTYQETVSDILETGYAFTDLEPRDYLVDLAISEGMTLAQAINQAIVLEEQAVAFYQEVTRRSQSLLATIPRAFSKVAGKRNERLTQLRTL
jgi:rubrerythrin